jgi:arsenical pump membrane protein
VLALLALAATLVTAVLRPPRLPEWLAALAGALLLLGVGALSLAHARAAVGSLGSTVGFLAALLVLAEGCRRQGVFEVLAEYLESHSSGTPSRFFALAFLASVIVTVVLGLDATVVLLTPIALATAARLRADPKPSAYACAHLANSASLLLPVSNLTNLLAFHEAGLSFTRFALVMAAPFALAVGIEWAVLRGTFSDALTKPGAVSVESSSHSGRPALSPEGRFALGVLVGTLVGFALSSVLGIAPVWIAVAGAVVMILPPLTRGGAPAAVEVVRAAQPGFLLFVFCLGMIVRTAADNGLRSAVEAVLPAGGTLPDLLLIAAISAAAANLLNNLPATLILIPVAGAFGLGPLLAVLVGVNLGPNLTYGGSLATLLWRRIVHPDGFRVEIGEFTRLGLLAVVPGLPLVTVALWASVRLFG